MAGVFVQAVWKNDCGGKTAKSVGFWHKKIHISETTGVSEIALTGLPTFGIKNP